MNYKDNKIACCYCGVLFDENDPSRVRTKDHKIPRARGGLGLPNNVCFCCYTCNFTKGDMTETEFRQWIALGRPHKKTYLASLPEREKYLHSKGFIRLGLEEKKEARIRKQMRRRERKQYANTDGTSEGVLLSSGP